MPNPGKRGRQERTLAEKLKILQYVDDHPGLKRTTIAAHFSMSPQTLSDLIKKSDQIRGLASAGSSMSGNKRLRASTHPEVDKALLIWFRQKACRPELRIDGSMLLQQATVFLKALSPDETAETISMSWIERWKKRHGVSRTSKAGESGGVDLEIVREWKEGKLQEILSTYRAEDIYNADETGLFWLLLPDTSLGFTGQSYHGAKQPKSRITVLVGANMDGSDKLPLYIIGKSKNPRAFKNVTVPLQYESNKKAWMTSVLFENWLTDLDKRMRRENRKIAMIIDNCPAHPTVDLTNIDLLFLPPNTTSHTQPMDSGIIKNLKYHYRHILALRRLQSTEEGAAPFSWNLLDSLVALKSAWRRVKVQTVANCFKKAGFIIPEAVSRQSSSSTEPEEVSVSVDPVPPEEVEFQNIWDRLRQVYGDAVGRDMNEYIGIDNEVETSPILNDEQIVQILSNPAAEDELGSDEDVEENDTDITVVEDQTPTLCQAYAAMRLLRRYGLWHACSDMEDIVFRLEAVLMDQSQNSLRQAKITDFMSRQ